MKKFIISLIILLWSSLASARMQEIGLDGARHLLNRTGFSASERDIRDFSKLSRELAAERLLSGALPSPLSAPPQWVDETPLPPSRLRNLTDDERKHIRQSNLERGLELREWWYREMLTTSSPFTERMTLFWHGHFATSLQKVRFPPLMYRQNLLLRKHALGNFAVMLHEIARDPAMVIYLDSAMNRKEHPNENFAREVMELFTLGEGQYQERDVKEVARAFTGWSIDHETWQFMFRPGMHDNGIKVVLGRSGNLNGDAVLDILLAQPGTAEFVVRKLWREFISPSPDEEEVHRLARVFRNSRYDIKTLMRAILTADVFYADDNRATLIKSPVELVVGTLRLFDIETSSLRPLVVAGGFLGQNVFSPPNVKGWPGGGAWINSATLLGRRQFLERVMMSVNMDGPKTGQGEQSAPIAGREARMKWMMGREGWRKGFDFAVWSKQFPPEGREQAIVRTVLAMPPQWPVGLYSGSDPGFIRRLVMDPAYQLK